MYVPHAREKLDETPVCESRPDDDVGSGDSQRLHVDTAQEECRERKPAES